MLVERDDDMESNYRVVPKKNYIIFSLVILFTFFLLYYFYMWFDAYNDNKINRPILDKYMDVINYNELSDYIVENPNSAIYVSVLENTEIRNFEIKFKNSLKSGEINCDLLYLDLTEEMKNVSIKREIVSNYAINSLNITNVPCILIIEDGDVKSIYGIKNNNYDLEKLKSFLLNNACGEME